MSAPLNTTYLQMFIYTKMYWVKAYILTWHTTGQLTVKQLVLLSQRTHVIHPYKNKSFSLDSCKYLTSIFKNQNKTKCLKLFTFDKYMKFEIMSLIYWGSCYSIFSFACMFCRSLFVLLSFFFCPLCFLSFFDVRILITPLISSSSSICTIQ